jgi:hypothetical protein
MRNAADARNWDDMNDRLPIRAKATIVGAHEVDWIMPA